MTTFRTYYEQTPDSQLEIETDVDPQPFPVGRPSDGVGQIASAPTR